MAHDNQRNFCLEVQRKHPRYFHKKLVLDIGSLDINGNNKFLFSSSQYLGVDVSQGANVDIITPGHLLDLPDSSFDTVISTECFEHDRHYAETLKNIVRLLKPGGMFLFTCATTGRPEHGTARTTPGDAPLIQEIADWRDYYKNLNENDIRAVLDIENIFIEFNFSVNANTCDLYFYGIKKGELIERNDYSFLLGRHSTVSGFVTESTGSIRPKFNTGVALKEIEIEALFLVTSPNEGGGIHIVGEGRCEKVSYIPSAGIATVSNILYVGFQPDELAAIGNKSFSFSNVDLDDIHDLLVHGDSLYVVGTTKNIIVEYSFNGLEVQRWSFSGEPDSRHINCLGVFGGKVVFSAFGDFQSSREYKGNTAGSGYIQELETGKRLITGLNQPHSLVEVAGNIVFANSGNYELVEYDSRGRFVRKKIFDAYVRGLALNNKYLAVGLSKSRDPDGQTISSGQLVFLDAQTWDCVYSVDIASDEVYSVMAIRDAFEAQYIADELRAHSCRFLEKKNRELLKSLVERDHHFAQVMRALREANEGIFRKLFSQDWYKSQYIRLIPHGCGPEQHFFELGGIDEGCMPSDNPLVFVEHYLSYLREKFSDQVADHENGCLLQIDNLNRQLTSAAIEFSATIESYRSANEIEKEYSKSELLSDFRNQVQQYEAKIQALEAENVKFVDEVKGLNNCISDLNNLRDAERVTLQNLHAEKISWFEKLLDHRLIDLANLLSAHADHSRNQLENISSVANFVHQEINNNSDEIRRTIHELGVNLDIRIDDSTRYIEYNITSGNQLVTAEIGSLMEKELGTQYQEIKNAVCELDANLDNSIVNSTRHIETKIASGNELVTVEISSLLQQELNNQGQGIRTAVCELEASLEARLVDLNRDIGSKVESGERHISVELNRLSALTDSIRQDVFSIYSSRFWRFLSIVKKALAPNIQPAKLDHVIGESNSWAVEVSGDLSLVRNNSENYQMNNIGYLMSLYGESFVVSSYKYILGRSPDSDGLSYYIACLHSGKDRLDVLGQIYNSEEARVRGIQDSGIEHLLGEFKKSKGLGGWVRRLAGEDIRSRLLQIEGHVSRIESLLERISHKQLEEPRGEEERVVAAPSNAPVFNLRFSGKDVVILTTPHCSYVADLMVRALERIAISAKVIFEMPHHGYEDVPHIVICPQMFPILPGFYVAYQMEQSVSSRWFTEEYLKRLENSFAIFDYSLTNVAHLQDKGLSIKQINYLPIGYIPAYKKRVNAAEEYDVLFYGDINNDRRRLYVSEISTRYNVKVINDCFGYELYSEMAKAKVVINVHYYEGALLETTRIFECLSNDKLIVSECSSDMEQHVDLVGIVDFVAVGNVQEMLDRLDYWLSDDSRRLAKIKQNTILLDKGFNEFEFYFYRFLLATDNIKYDKFWNIIGKYKPLTGSRLCLNLPEAVSRGDGFKADNFYGFEMFPGLRHSLGWVGCALSYKYMIMLAREHGLQRVAICEDDVEFPDDFSKKIGSVEKYLDSVEGDWDILSGLLANLNEEANILAIDNVGGIKYVTIDRLISMVFNIYSSRVFDIISNWDPENRVVATNTIDRYLESNSNLKVVTTAPFLVGHKEEMYSTLWEFKNTQYRDIINASAILLDNKIRDFGKEIAA